MGPVSLDAYIADIKSSDACGFFLRGLGGGSVL